MRVEQHVTFAWEVNADEDAVICAALELYSAQQPLAAVLLAARRDNEADAQLRRAMAQRAITPRTAFKLPDVDLLAEQEVETPS